MKRINYKDIEISPIRNIALNYTTEKAFIQRMNTTIQDKWGSLIYTKASDSICNTKEDIISLRNWLNEVIEYIDNSLTFSQAVEYLTDGKIVEFNNRQYKIDGGRLTFDGHGMILTSEMITGVWHLID